MKIIHAIPIDQKTGVETLSYFSQKDIPACSLILVPLRNKIIYAVAASSDETTDLKSVIKSNPYGLKKVTRVVASNFFTPEFLEAVRQTARFYASETGAILASLTPAKIPVIERVKNSNQKQLKTKAEKSVIQTNPNERFIQYKSLLRQCFSEGNSVVALVPTISDGEKLKMNVGKGIEKYTYFFHSGIGKKQLNDNFKKVSAAKHPILFVTTGGYLSLMPEKTGLLIVERESSGAYKTQSRPFMDFRRFAEKLSENASIPIVLGDEFVTLETYNRIKKNELATITTPKLRSQAKAGEEIVDMRDYKPTVTGKYTVLSSRLIEVLNENRANNDRAFLYVSRKGLAPNTVCGDCGSILTCKNCTAALVLHKRAGSNEKFYLCHRCGEKREAHTRCNNCDSWKLITLGAGAEKIEEEIKEAIPGAKVFRMDREIVKTRKTALRIMEEFNKTPGGILVGTELAIPYLDNIGLGAIASFDSLFCLPEYKINEKIMGILTRVRSLSTKKFIVQTRHADSNLINYGIKGNMASFYEEETSLRKKYEYPPFSIFTKISLKGDKNKIVKEMRALQTALSPEKISVFPALTALRAGRFGLHGLIKLKRADWPDKRVVGVLKNLPPYFLVNVEPESLL